MALPRSSPTLPPVRPTSRPRNCATRLLYNLDAADNKAMPPALTHRPSFYSDGRIDPATTWVRMPKWQQPDSWAKFEDPVCILRLALYGHPLAGVFWERKCRTALESVGFTPIQGWESVWRHTELGLVLSVYVDDFKMAGPTDNLQAGWNLIRQSGITIDLPTPFDHYQGCGQSTWMVPDDVFNKRMSTIRPHLPKYNHRLHAPSCTVRGIRHDMLGLTDQCIARYLECVSQLTTKTGSRRKRTPQAQRRSPSPASTPRSSSRSEDVAFPTPRSKATVGRSASPSAERPTPDTGITYDDLPHAETPGIEDTAFSEKDLSDPGVLGPDAASVLMKILYSARCCRFDLLYPVCMLAREITKWTYACD